MTDTALFILIAVAAIDIQHYKSTHMHIYTEDDKTLLIIFNRVREERKTHKEKKPAFRITQIVLTISCQFPISDSLQLFIV